MTATATALTLNEQLKKLDDGLNLENSPSRTILISLLAPLYKWLEHPEIEEIQINRPFEIIQRLRTPLGNGSIYVHHYDNELDFDYLTTLAYALANSSNTKNFGPNGNPVVHGTLPHGHRFVMGIGPNMQFHPIETEAQGTIAMVVRQFDPNMTASLDGFGVTSKSRVRKNIKNILTKDSDPNNPLSKILNSIARGDHILISGATGSGKTTFMRALIDKIDRNLRIVTVEDVRELVIPHENRMHILMQRSGATNEFTYKSVVDMIVRMTPDVVMAGEISTTNAATIWELMRSGHGHFMTTIHASSVNEAISTFITRIGHTYENEAKNREQLLLEMKEKMRIIQIEKVGNKRRVTEIS